MSKRIGPRYQALPENTGAHIGAYPTENLKAGDWDGDERKGDAGGKSNHSNRDEGDTGDDGQLPRSHLRKPGLQLVQAPISRTHTST